MIFFEKIKTFLTTKAKGDLAEDKAVKFLKKRKFKILDRNYLLKGGELDIIALKDETIHFIEVKSGTTFEPIYNITPKKLKLIIKTANRYIINKKVKDYFISIDAIIVKNNDIEFIENITM